MKRLNIEAIRLYRDALRETRKFNYPNEKGVLWSTVLKASVRKEFEQAKHERDPEIILKLLLGGRQSLEMVIEKVLLMD